MSRQQHLVSSGSLHFHRRILVSNGILGKLGNAEGEVILTRGAKKHNVIQMIPTLASCSFDEIVDAKQGDQAQWLQLYVNKDRAITERIIKHAEKRGCKGLFITVDVRRFRVYLFLFGRAFQTARHVAEEYSPSWKSATHSTPQRCLKAQLFIYK